MPDPLAWYYLIFELPFALAVLILVVQCLSGLHFGHDHHLELGHAGHVGHDVHVGGHDVHVSHDVGHAGAHHEAAAHHDGADHGHHAEHGEHPQHESILTRALSILGFGRVPMGIILNTMCFIWGPAGYFSNYFLMEKMHLPSFVTFVSIGIAFALTILFTGLVSSLVARWMPSTETYITQPTDLVGKRAEVIHTITQTSGTVRVRDDRGQTIDHPARVKEGPDITVPSEVMLVSYDESQKVFFVEPARV